MLERRGLESLTIEDRQSFRHVGLYGALERRMRDADLVFGVLSPEESDHASLLNLAFWKPGDIAELLPDPVITADQLAHNAWHHLAVEHLGEAARSPLGLLLAEAIASAMDVYWIGRLLGHVPDAEMLATQVPAMSEAAAAAGIDEEGFAALLSYMSEQPERAFEELRALLFDVTRSLLESEDATAAAAVLERQAEARFRPLLHHYELPTWVLFARAYGDRGVDEAPVRAVDEALRAAEDPIAWLERAWVETEAR
ncbi:MAG: hypothetical protein KC731_30210 [Myxococcales bacterium]|nr:hypothetical protein [Myxococcales bacterium]